MRKARGKENSRRRRTIELILTGLLVVFLLLFVAAWMTFQHKPTWYRPAMLDDVAIEQAKKESVNFIDSIGDRIVKGDPFTIELDEKQVTNWLAALPYAWPGVYEQIPPSLIDPAVRFEPDSIQLGVRWADHGWQAILGLKLDVRMNETGDGIWIRLVQATGGSIPVPQSLLQRILNPLLADGRRVDSMSNGSSALRFDQIHSVKQLFDGVKVTNRGIWFNGERPFEISDLHVGQGVIRVTLRPR